MPNHKADQIFEIKIPEGMKIVGVMAPKPKA
jgi:hypothetical protein